MIGPGLILAILVALIVASGIWLGVRIVPQGTKHVVERLGSFHRVLNPGLNIIVPFIDHVAYRLTTKDIVMDVPPQEVITKDNVLLSVNAVAFFSIVSPEKAAYGVESYHHAVGNLVQTSLRSIVGDMSLDEALSNRETIKARIKQSITDDVADWGITIKSVEIQDIRPSATMTSAMERQAAAERERRAMIAEADGRKAAAILNAEGQLEAARLEAQAKVALADADKQAIVLVASAIGNEQVPADFVIAGRYLSALAAIAASPNTKTLVLPGDLHQAVRGLFAGKGGTS